MDPFPPSLALADRATLPEEFRLILKDHPRDSWPEHQDFNGLAAFWLDRHLAFRWTPMHASFWTGGWRRRSMRPVWRDWGPG